MHTATSAVQLSVAPRAWWLRALAVVACVACVAGAVVLYAFDPAGTRAFPPCLLHRLTGLHCPGCGSLRAAHQLLHGNVAQAFALNSLMVLTLPVLVCAPIARRLGIIPPRWVLPAVYIWLLLGVILAYGVLRNVPVHPFTLLAPQAY